jgi:hypothetical protein
LTSSLKLKLMLFEHAWRNRPMAEALDDYLALIEREKDRRPAEAMLADEIHRLRVARWKLAMLASTR